MENVKCGMTEPTVKPAWMMLLQEGSQGPDQAQVQTWLNGLSGRPELKVDGEYGGNTVRAVRAYQQAMGLSVDGMVGSDTWNSMALSYRSRYGDEQVYPGIALRQGQQGGTVKALQQDLNEKDHAKLTADGKFGPATVQAVKMFQHCHGLNEDGVAGVNTWQALKNL